MSQSGSVSPKTCQYSVMVKDNYYNIWIGKFIERNRIRESWNIGDSFFGGTRYSSTKPSYWFSSHEINMEITIILVKINIRERWMF